MIEATQREIRAAIMPRAEIELRLQALQVELNRQGQDQLVLRTELTKIQLDLAKLRLPP